MEPGGRCLSHQECAFKQTVGPSPSSISSPLPSLEGDVFGLPCTPWHGVLLHQGPQTTRMINDGVRRPPNQTKTERPLPSQTTFLLVTESRLKWPTGASCKSPGLFSSALELGSEFIQPSLLQWLTVHCTNIRQLSLSN